MEMDDDCDVGLFTIVVRNADGTVKESSGPAFASGKVTKIVAKDMSTLPQYRGQKVELRDGHILFATFIDGIEQPTT